jgi:hypothetical protein
VTHPLAGSFSVEDSARLIRNYRYAAERMMRILGGWIALTPELPAKLLMGRQVWDNAQHADAFGRRLPELRAQAQVSEPSGPGFVRFMDAVEEPEGRHQTVERLVGIYRVLKPHLLETYRQHLAEANSVYEPPTCRILARCAEDEERHIRAGEAVLRGLLTAPDGEERARSWQGRLQALLDAAGGVTGRGAATAPRPAAARQGAGLAGSGEAGDLGCAERPWALPEGLASALGAFGLALVAGDGAGVRRWLLPGCPWDEALPTRVGQAGLGSHRLVAVARVGHHRVVKVRLEGAGGSMLVTARWLPAPEGWRVAAVDVVPHPAAPRT